MKRAETAIFELHFAELYHTGMTLIPAWKVLHLFAKDKGRLTKAFFRDEIFSLWSDYISEIDNIHITVNVVRADHGVLKPVAYLLTRDDFRYTDTATDTDTDDENDENESPRP
ncbi:hypothetical protein PS874_06430 [Pseudomonas fluorescens]|nr:hypothetical protein PS874_06430 [Pseudomonas fluorescens]